MDLLSDQIYAYRRRNKISQSDLATQLGVSLRTIQNYEKGKNIPKSKIPIIRYLIANERTSVLNELVCEKFRNIEIEEIIYWLEINRESIKENKAWQLYFKNEILTELRQLLFPN